MNKDWDLPWKSKGLDCKNDGQGFELWNTLWLEQAYRVLKQGSSIYVFSSTRTFHRVFEALSKVGFVDLDLEAWVYSSGFPKSVNIEKTLQDKLLHDMAEKYKGYGTGLKPAWEPICCGKKR
jgi:site-specific DNA-methyltransferase (adenine-specific)